MKSIADKIMSFGKQMIRNEFIIISTVLVIFILLFFAPTLIQGKLPTSSSYVLEMYPWSYYNADYKPGAVPNNVLSDQYDNQIPIMQFFLTELRHGEYPMWNPYVNSGTPDGLIFVDHDFSIYRPLTILAGVQWGSLLYVFLKLYIVGIFIYFYLRYRKFNWPSALLGSLVLMFSAHMIVNAGRHVPDLIVYAPAILYFAERFVHEKKYRHFIGLAVFVGVAIVSGFPSVTMYTLLLLAIYLTYRNLIELNDQPIRQRVLNLFWLYAAFGAGLLLVAFTVLPTYEYLQYINLGYRMGRGAATLQWITAGRLINPNICGNPIQGNWFCPTSYNETALYVGLLPLMLIPFSLINKKNRLTSYFFLASAMLVLMIVFGVASLNKIVGSLPLFNINPNTRMIALLPICFAFITATGVDNLTRVNKMAYWSLFYFLALGVCARYLFGVIPFASTKVGSMQYFLNQNLFTLFLLGGYTLIFLIIFIFSQRVLNLALIALVLLSFLERAVLLGGYQGSSYADTFYPETAATTFLESDMPNYERMIVLGRNFAPSIPLYYSINALTGHWLASVAFKGNMDLIDPGFYERSSTQPLFSSSSVDLTSPLLDLYRVRYVATSPSDEPIWYESLADQKEYNQSFMLSKLTSFGQSITIDRNGYAELLEIRIDAPGEDPIPVSLKIFSDEQLVLEIDSQLTRQGNGWYIVNLPKLPLMKGQLIRFEITPQKGSTPSGALVYTVNSNIYKGGSLFIDGKSMTGDIAFSLMQYNPVIAEKYKLVHSGDMNIYENETVSNEIPVINKLRYSDQDSVLQN